MKRITINELNGYFDKEVTIQGFVEKIRDLQYVQFVILRDSTGKVQITIEKNDDNIHSYVRVFINFVRAVFFEDMKNEQDEWLDAYETVFELNKLIRNLFPGYTILSDEEIASRK